MSIPSGQSCANCIYFVSQSMPERPLLTCRHGSPVLQHGIVLQPAWPQTEPDYWCGRWSGSPASATPAPQLPVISGVVVAPPNITVTADTMLGLAFGITPVATGRVAAIISGTLTSSTANSQINITGRHGVGVAPANGAAAVGQLWATTQHYYTSTARDVNGFTVLGGNPSLAIGVPVWFDISVASPAGGTTTIADLQCLLWEL